MGESIGSTKRMRVGSTGLVQAILQSDVELAMPLSQGMLLGNLLQDSGYKIDCQAEQANC